MKAQPYLRTSTDDKGQDPLRQMERIGAWAKTERVQLLEPVADDGTSGSVEPLDRPKFLEAVAKAKAAGAKAIIVEAQDRFTRQGIKRFYVSVYRLEQDHGLKLLTADQPRDQQESFVGEVMRSIKAEMAREWLDEHRKKVKAKLDKIRCTVHVKGQMPDATCTGKHLGRRWKGFNESEDVMILSSRRRGLGWASIALEINRARGVLDIVTPEVRRRKGTSQGAVRRRFLQLVSDTPLPQTPEAPVHAN